jgi:hypothetical protein
LSGVEGCASLLFNLVAVRDGDVCLAQNLRVWVQNVSVATVVAVKVRSIGFAAERIGAGSAALGQTIGLVWVRFCHATNQRPEERYRGADDGCTDFGNEPDERESSAIREVGIAGNIGDSGSFVYAHNTSPSGLSAN